MSWKSLGPGKFSFSGAIIPWAEQFQKWFQEDTKNNKGIVYESYFSALVFSYARFAKEKWNRSGSAAGRCVRSTPSSKPKRTERSK